MTPRSKGRQIKRLQNQQLRVMNNPSRFENLQKRIDTLVNTKDGKR